MLGEKKPISAAVNHCLAKLRITNLRALICKNRKRQAVLIDTTELTRRHGLQAQARHMKALNKLTLLAKQGTAGCTASLANVRCANNASNLRTIHSNLLEAKFAKHRRRMPQRLGGEWAPNNETHGNQLIETAFARVLQAPLHPDSSVDQLMNNVTLPKARRSRKRKPDPAFAKRHVIDTMLPSSPQPQRKAKRGKARKPKAAINDRMAVTVGQTGKSLDEWLQQPSPAQTSCPPPTGWTHIPQIDGAAVRASFDDWQQGRGLGSRLQAGKTCQGICIKPIQSGMPESQCRACQHPKRTRRPGVSRADQERFYGERNHMWRVLAKCKRSGQCICKSYGNLYSC